MSETCEKCNSGYDDTIEDHNILGIPCTLCRPCFRSWARRYHKNPDTTRFEVLSERMNFLRASNIGKPLDPARPFAALDSLVEAREALELKLIEDTIDWLEETL